MKYRHSLAYANKHDAPTVKWAVGLGYRRPQWQDNNSALGLRPTFIAMMPRQVIRPAGLAKGSSRHWVANATPWRFPFFRKLQRPYTSFFDACLWVGASNGRNGLRTKGNALLSHPSMKHGKRCVFDAGTGVFPWVIFLAFCGYFVTRYPVLCLLSIVSQLFTKN